MKRKRVVSANGRVAVKVTVEVVGERVISMCAVDALASAAMRAISDSNLGVSLANVKVKP